MGKSHETSLHPTRVTREGQLASIRRRILNTDLRLEFQLLFLCHLGGVHSSFV